MAITINDIPAAQLGVTGGRLDVVNQGESAVELQLDGADKASTVLAAGMAVTVVADGFTFHGKVQARPWSDEGGRRGYKVLILDRWADLAGTTIVGSSTLAANAIALNTRVALCGKFSPYSRGEGDSTTYDVVSIPPSEWLPLVLAELSMTVSGAPTQRIPAGQRDAIKVANAVKDILKWFPGTVATVGGQEAALTVYRPSAMELCTVPYAAPTTKVAVNPRYDAVLSGVGLWLRKVRSSNLHKTEVTSFITAGEATGPRAFVAPIDLFPETHQLAWADMELLKLEPNDIDFWIKAKPDLKVIPGIESGEVTSVNVVKTDNSLGYVILRGSLPKEFEAGCSGPFGKRAKLIGVSNGISPKIGQVVIQAEITVSGSRFRLELVLPATSLISLTEGGQDVGVSRYVREDKDEADDGEAFGDFANLPAQIYADASKLLHQGTATWKLATIPSLEESPFGKLIRFSDSPWSAIDSPVHRMSIDLFNRDITVAFGIDGWLGVEDRVGLERMHKRWPRPPKKRVDEDGTEPKPMSPTGGPVGSNPTIAPPADQAVSVGPLECVPWPGNKVRIGASNFNGQPIPGFAANDNAAPYLINAGSGGQWWVHIYVSNSTTGELACSTGTGSMPNNSNGHRYELVCSWTVAPGGRITTHNNRLGPIEATACRDPYNATPTWQITVGN